MALRVNVCPALVSGNGSNLLLGDPILVILHQVLWHIDVGCGLSGLTVLGGLCLPLFGKLSHFILSGVEVQTLLHFVEVDCGSREVGGERGAVDQDVVLVNGLLRPLTLHHALSIIALAEKFG